jgi:hypothetical protein
MLALNRVATSEEMGAPDYESGGRRFESFRARHGSFSPRQIRNNLIINRFEACRWYQSVGPHEGYEQRF